jgi:ribosome-binding protein aMBF1 (putative translation factor)
MSIRKAKSLKQDGANQTECAITADWARPRASSTLDQRIGRRIREARTSRNLSLMQMAELAQIAPQQLQKYETARTRVSASRLYQLAQILDRPVFWFFEEN